MTTAAPTAATPEPKKAMARRGSFATSAIRGAMTAAAAHAYRRARSVCELVAAKSGVAGERTTIASTDQTAWVNAEAAGGASTAALVTHECSGQRASRPATPTKRSTEATTRDLRLAPGVV